MSKSEAIDFALLFAEWRTQPDDEAVRPALGITSEPWFS